MNEPARILVVEDNEDNRTLLGIYLHREGYEVREARDGQEGWEIACQETFDMILSDVQMPRMDGYTLCRKLKENPQTEKIPIILITAVYTSIEDTLEGLHRGANDFVSRPFRQSELLARVQTQLRIKELQDRLIQAERVATVARVAVTMADRINNPLMGITGYVELLLGMCSQGEVNQAEAHTLLRRVYQDALQIRDALQQLRDVTEADVYQYALGMEGIVLGKKENGPTAGEVDSSG